MRQGTINEGNYGLFGDCYDCFCIRGTHAYDFDRCRKFMVLGVKLAEVMKIEYRLLQSCFMLHFSNACMKYELQVSM